MMMKKAISIVGGVTVAVVLALLPALVTIYGEAYPAASSKRMALAACAREEPAFNRFMRAERAHCYARLQIAPASPSPVPRRIQVVELAR